VGVTEAMTGDQVAVVGHGRAETGRRARSTDWRLEANERLVALGECRQGSEGVQSGDELAGVGVGPAETQIQLSPMRDDPGRHVEKAQTYALHPDRSGRPRAAPGCGSNGPRCRPEPRPTWSP
jgi:hypothetical protein